MKIALGSDHAGYQLKEQVKEYLAEMGHTSQDFGTFDGETSVDYPDFAITVARAVAGKEFPAGILVCGTGIGMSIVANKVRGIRAALCNDALCASFARSHNDANILVLAQRMVAPGIAREIVRVFFETPFSGGRHARRLEKISRLEEDSMKRVSPADTNY